MWLAFACVLVVFMMVSVVVYLHCWFVVFELLYLCDVVVVVLVVVVLLCWCVSLYCVCVLGVVLFMF